MKFSNFKLYDSNRTSGFTLIEAVVAAAVFAVAMTSIVGAFLAVLRVDAKSRSIRAVEQNARFITEFLTREIRNGSLNYALYTGGIPPSTATLHLINPSGDRERIFLSGSTMQLEKIVNGITYTTNISAQDTLVSNMNFYIEPSTNPFLASGPDQQPYITFTFTLTSETSSGTRDEAVIRIQSTVSSRDYPLEL